MPSTSVTLKSSQGPSSSGPSLFGPAVRGKICEHCVYKSYTKMAKIKQTPPCTLTDLKQTVKASARSLDREEMVRSPWHIRPTGLGAAIVRGEPMLNSEGADSRQGVERTIFQDAPQTCNFVKSNITGLSTVLMYLGSKYCI